MKIFAVDDNYNFIFRNGDFSFRYDNRAILSLSKQVAETIKGEIPGLDNYGVLSFDSMSTLAQMVTTLTRLVEAVSDIQGVIKVNASNVSIKGNSYVYELNIATDYGSLPASITIEQG